MNMNNKTSAKFLLNTDYTDFKNLSTAVCRLHRFMVFPKRKAIFFATAKAQNSLLAQVVSEYFILFMVMALLTVIGMSFSSGFLNNVQEACEEIIEKSVE